MFTKVLYALVLVIISVLATSVHSAILGCDPFPATKPFYYNQQLNYFIRDYYATCPDSVLTWTTKSNGLEITAFMDSCANVPEDATSAASAYFSVFPQNPFDNDYDLYRQYYLNVSSDSQYYFEYSIKWMEDNTFCVVDLTGSPINSSEVISINMTDQNGIRNTPTEVRIRAHLNLLSDLTINL